MADVGAEVLALRRVLVVKTAIELQRAYIAAGYKDTSLDSCMDEVAEYAKTAKREPFWKNLKP